MEESTFGHRLEKLMREKGITRKALKDDAGISLQSISNYLKGKRKPDCEMVAEISRALGVSADYLLGLSEVSTRNETIQGINRETGLWGDAIVALRTEKFCGDDEISDFVSYLIKNKDFLRLIRAIKQKNNYSDSDICSLDVDGKDQTISMGSLWKVIITDLFWEIAKGYTAKPGEVMVSYKTGESNG